MDERAVVRGRVEGLWQGAVGAGFCWRGLLRLVWAQADLDGVGDAVVQ